MVGFTPGFKTLLHLGRTLGALISYQGKDEREAGGGKKGREEGKKKEGGGKKGGRYSEWFKDKVGTCQENCFTGSDLNWYGPCNARYASLKFTSFGSWAIF